VLLNVIPGCDLQDEADANWTTHVTPETLRSWEMARTKREQQLYRLLGTPPLNRKTPPLNSSKPPLSRVRSVIHVSATHIITAQFHAMWGLVFKCMVASEAMVRNFTSCHQMSGYESLQQPWHGTERLPLCNATTCFCLVCGQVSERGYVVPEDLQAYRPGGPGQPEVGYIARASVMGAGSTPALAVQPLQFYGHSQTPAVSLLDRNY
jgi:hypothetical protein